MPVRSLDSSVIRWPSKHEVEKAIQKWVNQLIEVRADIMRVGYFGSYATGNWGVGSDLDVIVILEKSEQDFERRGIQFDTGDLPVPSDILVYSAAEWNKMKQEDDYFYRRVSDEVIWVYL